jgi:hypothetical protein
MTLMPSEEDSENEASSRSFLAIPLAQEQILSSFDMLPGAQEGEAISFRDDATTTTIRSSVGILPSPIPFLSSFSRRVQALVDDIADCILSLERAASKSAVPSTPASPAQVVQQMATTAFGRQRPDHSDGRPTLSRGMAVRFDTTERLQTALK